MRFWIEIFSVTLCLLELVFGGAISPEPAHTSTDAQSSSPVSALVTLERLRDRLDVHQRSSCHAAAREALFANQDDSPPSPSPWPSEASLGSSAQDQLGSGHGGSGYGGSVGNHHEGEAAPLRCSGECSKLHIALALAQCILQHTSQAPIPCGSDAIMSTSGGSGSSCVLLPGCLTAAPAADGAATSPPSFASTAQSMSTLFNGGGSERVRHDLPPQHKNPHFNVPTQQSVVFSEAYQHVESLCSYLALSSLMNANVDLARASRGAALEILAVTKAAAAYGQEERAAMRELGLRVGDTLATAEEAKQIAQRTLQMSNQTLMASEKSAIVLENVRDTALSNQELLHEANHRLEDSISFSLELLDLAEKSFKMVAALAQVLQVAERSAGRVAQFTAAVLALLLLRAVLMLVSVATWAVTQGPLSWVWWLPWVALKRAVKAWLALVAAAAPTLVSTVAILLSYPMTKILWNDGKQQQLLSGGDNGSCFPGSDVDNDNENSQDIDDNNIEDGHHHSGEHGDHGDDDAHVRTPPLASARVVFTAPMSDVSEHVPTSTPQRSSRNLFNSSCGRSGGGSDTAEEARTNPFVPPTATTTSGTPPLEVASPLMEQRLLAALAAHEARASAGQRQFREATFQAAFRAAHVDADAQLSTWKQEASRLLASERQARKRLMDDLSSQLNTTSNGSNITPGSRTPSTTKRLPKSHKKRRTSLQP